MTLVNEDYPMGNLGRFKHHFVEPEVPRYHMIQASPEDETHMFHVPLLGCFIGSHQPFLSKKGKHCVLDWVVWILGYILRSGS